MVLEIHELTDTAELRIPGVARYASGGLHLLLRGCKGFVVHSAYDRDQVLARWQLPAERALVVHHGPFDHGPRNSDVADTDVPGEESAIRLLFFGTIRPYKGLEYLIEAFNLLSPEEADKLSLTVVGETWENWIRPAELIETSPYRDRITFVNRYVCDQELHRHLRNADLVVLPYLRSSASGPLHQAMSYGLPVMVTSVGGLLEAAADYEGTTFITPRSAEAIAEGLRSAIASGVRRYQPTGKWSNTVQEYIAFFATIGVAK
jgi:glycosyltransferase involved in cell wall biosynthesis